MEYDIRVGEVWTRERDGMVAKVETVDAGSHGYVRWRPIEGGRLRWNWKWEFGTGWTQATKRDDFAALIEASSLGTESAKAARATVSDERAAEFVALANRQD